MTPNQENPNTLLARARSGDDPDALAEALAVHANFLLQAGKFSGARVELDEAATLHHSRGRAYDEARCTQFAATVCRIEGRLSDARQRAQTALQLAGPGTRIAVSAETELGEIAMAEGDFRKAAAAYGEALSHGDAAGLVETVRAALLRKRAEALARAGLVPEAARDLLDAHDRLLRLGDSAGALEALLERTTALQQGAHPAAAERALEAAFKEASLAKDDAALANLHLLRASRAIQNRDPQAALEEVRTARDLALKAPAPLIYLSAAVAISQIADSIGDRATAYQALAVGWVTLGDVLGKDFARSIFAPKLQALQDCWGPAVFAEIKASYEDRRRHSEGRTV